MVSLSIHMPKLRSTPYRHSPPQRKPRERVFLCSGVNGRSMWLLAMVLPGVVFTLLSIVLLAGNSMVAGLIGLIMMIVGVALLLTVATAQTRVSVGSEELLVSWLWSRRRLPMDGLVIDFPRRSNVRDWRVRVRSAGRQLRLTGSAQSIQALERCLLQRMRRAGLRSRDRKSTRASLFGPQPSSR